MQRQERKWLAAKSSGLTTKKASASSPKMNSGKDVFVHHSSIVGSGFKTFNEGDTVSFEVVAGEKGLKAENVQRVQAP